MGVIQRQGIKQSFAVLLGSIVGGLNNIILFPKAFAPEQIGLIRVFQDTAMLLVPFLMLGASGLTVRFFPRFQDKDNGHNGFLPLLILLVGSGILTFLILLLVFQTNIIGYYREQSPLISDYYFYMIPVVIGFTLSALLAQYSSNFMRIAIPSLISQSVKPIMAIMALGYAWHWVTFDQFIGTFTFWYLISLGLLVLYIRSLGQLHLAPNWQKVDKPLLKEMSTYAAFGLMASAGSNLIFKTDTIMLASMIDLSQTGVYTISAYIASIIMIPTNALISISSPIISKAMNINDLDEVRMVYKKSSINLTIIGLLFMILIVASIHDLFNLMPNGEIYKVGIPVIYILMSAKFFDMLTSVNNEVIGYSKYFRINFYSLMTAGLTNILLNYLLIPYFGMIGPAIATTISLLFFNLFKLEYIWRKFKMHPFGKGHLSIFGIALLTSLLIFIPFDSGYPLINILVKSTVIGLVFVLLTIKWKVSMEFSELILGFLRKLKR